MCIITQRASCGAVYCNRSCLWVGVCVCARALRRRPPSGGGGAGWPKFNQLEYMVTTFTYRPSLVKIDARNFELSW